MILRDWLKEREMSFAEFARVSGIGQRALVQKYVQGRQLPSFENLERIRIATGELVTANDFVAQRVAALKANAPKPSKPAAKPKRSRARASAAAEDTPTRQAEAA